MNSETNPYRSGPGPYQLRPHQTTSSLAIPVFAGLLIAWMSWSLCLWYSSGLLMEESFSIADVPENLGDYRDIMDYVRPRTGHVVGNIIGLVVVPGITIMLSMLAYFAYQGGGKRCQGWKRCQGGKRCQEPKSDLVRDGESGKVQ